WLQRWNCVSRHEGRLFGLPIVDGDAASRHRKFAASLFARCGRSQTDGMSRARIRKRRNTLTAAELRVGVLSELSTPVDDGRRGTMRVLAIDTALEACAAAGLDTSAGTT